MATSSGIPDYFNSMAAISQREQAGQQQDRQFQEARLDSALQSFASRTQNQNQFNSRQELEKQQLSMQARAQALDAQYKGLQMDQINLGMDTQRANIATNAEVTNRLNSDELRQAVESGETDRIRTVGAKLTLGLSPYGAKKFTDILGDTLLTVDGTQASQTRAMAQKALANSLIQKDTETYAILDRAVQEDDISEAEIAAIMSDPAKKSMARSQLKFIQMEKDVKGLVNEATSLGMKVDPATLYVPVEDGSISNQFDMNAVALLQKQVADQREVKKAESLADIKVNTPIKAKDTLAKEALAKRNAGGSEEEYQNTLRILNADARGNSISRKLDSDVVSAEKIRGLMAKEQDPDRLEALQKQYTFYQVKKPDLIAPLMEVDEELSGSLKRLRSASSLFKGKTGGDWFGLDTEAKDILPDIETAYTNAAVPLAEREKDLTEFKEDRGSRQRIVDKARGLLRKGMVQDLIPNTEAQAETQETKSEPASIPTITSREERNKLPAGAEYMFNGVKYKTPTDGETPKSTPPSIPDTPAPESASASETTPAPYVEPAYIDQAKKLRQQLDAPMRGGEAQKKHDALLTQYSEIAPFAEAQQGILDKKKQITMLMAGRGAGSKANQDKAKILKGEIATLQSKLDANKPAVN